MKKKKKIDTLEVVVVTERDLSKLVKEYENKISGITCESMCGGSSCDISCGRCGYCSCACDCDSCAVYEI